MSFNEPIYVHNFDQRADAARLNYPPERRIEIIDYPYFDSTTFDTDVSSIYNKFRIAFLEEIKAPGTVVLDTETVLWEIMRLIHMQELEAIAEAKKKLRESHYLLPTEYGIPNSRMRTLFYALRNRAKEFQKTGKGVLNLVVIAHQKEEYRNDKGTGKMIPDWWKETNGICDIIISQALGTDEEENVIPISTVTKCGTNLELTGLIIPNANYKKLYTLLVK